MEDLDLDDLSITGWLICRLPEQDDDDRIDIPGKYNNYDSIDRKPLIHCALYGQFNQSDLPPRKKWVFLGSELLKNVNLGKINFLFTYYNIHCSYCEIFITLICMHMFYIYTLLLLYLFFDIVILHFNYYTNLRRG